METTQTKYDETKGFEYGANGGVEPPEASKKSYEPHPGQTVGTGSDVQYFTTTTTTDSPGVGLGSATTYGKSTCQGNYGGARCTDHAQHIGTHNSNQPDTHAGKDLEKNIKSAVDRGADRVDDIRDQVGMISYILYYCNILQHYYFVLRYYLLVSIVIIILAHLLAKAILSCQCYITSSNYDFLFNTVLECAQCWVLCYLIW